MCEARAGGEGHSLEQIESKLSAPPRTKQHLLKKRFCDTLSTPGFRRKVQPQKPPDGTVA